MAHNDRVLTTSHFPYHYMDNFYTVLIEVNIKNLATDSKLRNRIVESPTTISSTN